MEKFGIDENNIKITMVKGIKSSLHSLNIPQVQIVEEDEESFSEKETFKKNEIKENKEKVINLTEIKVEEKEKKDEKEGQKEYNEEEDKKFQNPKMGKLEKTENNLKRNEEKEENQLFPIKVNKLKIESVNGKNREKELEGEKEEESKIDREKEDEEKKGKEALEERINKSKPIHLEKKINIDPEPPSNVDSGSELSEEEYRSRIRNEFFIINDKDIAQIRENIENDIKRMLLGRKNKEKKVPLIDYLKPENKKELNNYIEMQLDLNNGKMDEIFLPPLESIVNNIKYRTVPAFLDEISSNNNMLSIFLKSLLHYGFEVPIAIIKNIKKDTEVFTFENLLSYFPDMFYSYGPVATLNEIFSPPNIITAPGAIYSRKATQEQIKRFLSNVPDSIKDPSYISELLTILYLSDAVPSTTIVSPNSEKLSKIYQTALDRISAAQKENNEEIKIFLENTQEYVKTNFKEAKVINPKDSIVLLNEEQDIVSIKAYELAKVIRNSLVIMGPDLVVGYILRNFIPEEIDTNIIEDLLTNYYVGTGSLKMIPQRYNKSLKIYKESNSPECKKFHKKYYEEEFLNFLYDFGYYYDGEKVKIPDTPQEYLSMISIDKSLLNKVNPVAHGTFTSFKRRDETGFMEIKLGLAHFKNITNDQANPSFIFFYIAFKNIAAKLKDEIHNLDKPPRFFNPTFISAFIPFQLVLNKAFDTCPFLSDKCPHSLLGITDTGHIFSDLMEFIVDVNDYRWHYSDNFWIKENNQFVSVDVSRCDSNLSKEALKYPLKALGKMVLSEEDYGKFEIIVDLFVQTIPRNTFLSLGKNNNCVLLSLLFYWLPSGVVGTAYLNHLFTGFFLYYTKKDKWIKEDGTLTDIIIEKSQKFGIHLEVASYIKFDRLVNGKVYNFDLLGRSGIYYNDNFIPVLEEKRVWQAILFMKKTKYDKNPLIGDFVRLQKIDTLANLGAYLYPNIRQSLFGITTVLTTLLREMPLKMTAEQIKSLHNDLDSFKISPVSFEKFIFKSFVPSIRDYVYEKTGKKIDNPDWVKFDNKILEKISIYKEMWALIMPVVKGYPTEVSKNFSHDQWGFFPYKVYQYLFEFLNQSTDRIYTLKNFITDLGKIYGERRGISIFKDFLRFLISLDDSPFSRSFKKEFSNATKNIVKYLVEDKKVPVEKLKHYPRDFYKYFIKNVMEKVEYQAEYNKETGGLEKIQIMTLDNFLKPIPFLFKNLNLLNVFDSPQNELWKFFEKGELGQKFNDLVSKNLFEGASLADMKKKKIIRAEMPLIKGYRDLPITIKGKGFFDPVRVNSYNEKMVIQGFPLYANDLGLLTGLVSYICYKNDIVPRPDINIKLI